MAAESQNWQQKVETGNRKVAWRITFSDTATLRVPFLLASWIRRSAPNYHPKGCLEYRLRRYRNVGFADVDDGASSRRCSRLC
ncbi:hypothetical protein F441_16750 [Phytophthora nicotianae CJ01A1]|uniref:Uncharacterized protein n=2 Tax=Phytophthora nicotianae TaxID=4792 RepID=W2WA76_PHYNI|nr:hypothetical protein L915_16438 [Phytophthora nicotianae]ETP06918.1 hypothetical protein F441_16750 [Phytophthora nicotianae CJ01A1]